MHFRSISNTNSNFVDEFHICGGNNTKQDSSYSVLDISAYIKYIHVISTNEIVND